MENIWIMVEEEKKDALIKALSKVVKVAIQELEKPIVGYREGDEIVHLIYLTPISSF